MAFPPEKAYDHANKFSLEDGKIGTFLKFELFVLSDIILHHSFKFVIVYNFFFVLPVVALWPGLPLPFFIFLVATFLFSWLAVIPFYIRDNFIPDYRRWKLFKDGTQLGYGDKRIAQLQFSTWERDKTQYFLSDLWFDIVAYIRNPNDELDSYLSENSWLEGFVRPSEKDKANWTFEEGFRKARKEFELSPEEFVRHLEQFSKYVRIRDLSESLIAYLARPSDGPRRMEMWLNLQNEIDLLLQSADSSAPSAIHVAPFTALKRSLSVVKGVKISKSESLAPVADQLQRFIQRSIDDGQSRKDEIERSWREERLRSLEKVFDNVRDQKLLLEISLCLKNWSEASRKLPSVEQEKFQSNVCLFVEYMTGRKDLEYQGAIAFLRDLALKKSNQWSILYKKIEEQDSEIARQKQVITCLEYRHVLENLPNKDCADIVANGVKATPVWKETWKLAVELELDNMIRDYIMARNPGLPGLPPPAPPSRLRPLIQSDFDFWASQRLTKVASIAPSVSITSSPLLVQQHRPPYKDWSIYQRGLTMYNELSSTIHKYGKSYEINESNWAKSDKLIFEWLKPDLSRAGEVDWDQEWSDRSFPP